MNDIVYTKVFNGDKQPFLVVYERGNFQTPILILKTEDISAINVEWARYSSKSGKDT